MYWLVIGILCVWRVTHLLHAESGPGDAIAKFRRVLGVGFFGTLIACFLCLSLWVAIPFALLIGESGKERLLLWLAFSAGAILLERLTSLHPSPVQAIYSEDEVNDENAVRWKEEQSGSRTLSNDSST